jgi:hypothetical protein
MIRSRCFPTRTVKQWFKANGLTTRYLLGEGMSGLLPGNSREANKSGKKTSLEVLKGLFQCRTYVLRHGTTNLYIMFRKRLSGFCRPRSATGTGYSPGGPPVLRTQTKFASREKSGTTWRIGKRQRECPASERSGQREFAIA